MINYKNKIHTIIALNKIILIFTLNFVIIQFILWDHAFYQNGQNLILILVVEPIFITNKCMLNTHYLH